MKISWLGHACFLLETLKGTRIITDPYQVGGYSGAIGYSPIGINPDIVTVSHQHADHNYTKEFLKAEILTKEGNFKIKDVEIIGFLSYHDSQKGSLRGKNIIFVILADGLKIVHFGDLGTLDIDYKKLENVDIALVPVGGIFTIDAIEATQLISKIAPKITIPMHFKTPKLGFEIASVDNFIKDKDVERREYLEVIPQNLNNFKKVIVLKYLR